MATNRVDPKLLQRLRAQLRLSPRQVYRLITQKSNATFLPRNLAAVSVAAEHGIPISKFATSEDLATIRQQGPSRQAPIAPVTVPETAQAQPRRRNGRKPAKSPGKRRGNSVFVVHGRNEEIRRSLFQFMRSVGLNPIEWRRAIALTGKPSPHVAEILDAAFREAVAVIVLLTPDDEARLRREFVKQNDPAYERKLTPQPRPNVLFEAGMAFGRYPDATILVQIGDVRPFSDVAGRHVAHLSDSVDSRQELIIKLANAGCNVDSTGTDWHTEGSFTL